MKCPKCGAEMPAGSLYCEQCGEDIHIVPDFEPEVELNIEKTISGIVDDIKEERKDSDREDDEFDEEEKASLLKIFWENPYHGMLTIIGMICVVAVVSIGIFVYQYHSVEVQTQKARDCVENEEYDKAIKYYSRALELSDNDVAVMFKLAEVYFLKNNKIEYEYLLREIVADSSATNEQITSAYGKLIAIYRAREDFESINELLLASDNQEVMHTYQDYVAMSPEFSIQEGFYTDVQPVKLTAYGSGKIYYTLDGSVPTEKSEQYIAPIILDAGEHVISAYFVNGYGIASEVVTKRYQIEIEELSKPAVETVSGDYTIPTYIQITENTEGIYYTTDGSTPTVSSTPYTGPIPMPLGKSNYNFIRIEGGRSSEVVRRSYNLELDTVCTPEEAEKEVLAYSIQSGKIIDESGVAIGVPNIYKYEYQYVIKMSEAVECYVIAEYIMRGGEEWTKTGSYFAVDVYDMELFKLQIDEDNNYTLVEIEEQSR